MAQICEGRFPGEILPGRRFRVTVGEISLVFAESGKGVTIVRHERDGRDSRNLRIECDREFHAAVAQAKRHFRSLRPAALKESLAAQRAEREARRVSAAVSASRETSRQHGARQLRQAGFNFAA